MTDLRTGAVIGLDVGGTAMKGLLVGPAGECIAQRRRPTPAASGPDAVVEEIRSLCRELGTQTDQLQAAGIAVPGIVDPVAGVARYAANLGWTDVPLAALLSTDLGVPVRLDHDVRSAGLAESRLGAGRGIEEFLFLPVGTGIAAAMSIGAEIRAGASGAAGELGHVPVYPGGEPCACGQRGCLETYASAAAVRRRYIAAGGSSDPDAQQIVARLGADPIADTIWREACTALGIALATYTLIADPAVIVIGGGMAAAGAALLDPVRSEITARLAWRPGPDPTVVVAELGPTAGAIGAALLGWQAAGHPTIAEDWAA
ncbi:MAG: ROK family protein [Jatrophihabitans sp.]